MTPRSVPTTRYPLRFDITYFYSFIFVYLFKTTNQAQQTTTSLFQPSFPIFVTPPTWSSLLLLF